MQNFSLENHHMMNARQPLCWWMTFTKVLNPFLPSPHKWLTWTLDVCGGVGYGWFYWFSLKIFFQTSPELETFQRDWNNDVVFFFFSTLSIMSDIFFQCRIFQFFPGLLWQNDLEQRNSVRIYFHPPIGHNRSFKKAEKTISSITVTVIDEFVFSAFKWSIVFNCCNLVDNDWPRCNAYRSWLLQWFKNFVFLITSFLNERLQYHYRLDREHNEQYCVISGIT